MRSFLLLFILFNFSLVANQVIVSVAPIKFLVEEVGGSEVTCSLIVPPQTSPHSYEPTLKQVVALSQADIWFRIGEGFENRIVKALQGKMTIVDLRQDLPLLSSSCGCQMMDTHIWLSPKLLKIEVAHIVKALSEKYPTKKELFEENGKRLTEKLHLLDEKLKIAREKQKEPFFLVSHPAFGYFCHDYHMEELSIEINGKEPTLKQIDKLLEESRKKEIRKVVILPQYSTKAALLIAKELQAHVVTLDPYRENVVENLEDIANVVFQ